MPDALATTPASANFQKLKDKLRELFELDKADLDFGIYRVLRQRHREIIEFLDNHLETTVREALRSHQSIQTDQVADDLAKAEAAAKAAGFAPDQSPKVQELRERLKSAGDVEAVADEVYSHLLIFFSRYYQEGDFIGLHRSTVHGREKYMIPYNGEEVKLVWANMDQYYIKSSELLRDYTFLIKKSDWLAAQAELPLGDLPDEVRVHFKLVEGDTEKDNRKASGKTTRAFALAEPACTEKDGALYINFAYREHAAERNLQDKLNADTIKTLAGALPGVWRTLLLGTDPTYQPKDKKDTRTVLQKHLRAYTARHQFDYFIHKDLGSFLRRELDFYLKNEVMHLDDIENAGSSKAEEYLSKLRAIRRCATPVIRMLAQLEDFQKKLWLKKKFVVETHYCLTLDRVPEELYPEICKNDAQWLEWEELYKISELKPKRTVEFLKANKHLIVDSRHFGKLFIDSIITSINDIDSSLNGICLYSENTQALGLLGDRFQNSITTVFIDPPYNTDNDINFPYKDSFERSSWMACISQSAARAFPMLKESGLFFFQIGDTERAASQMLLDSISATRKNTISARRGVKNVQAQFPDIEKLSFGHDVIHVYGKEPKSRIPHLKQALEAENPGKWDTFWRGTDRPTMRYALLGVSPESGQWRWEENRAKKAVQNYNTYLETESGRKTLDEWYIENLQAGNDLDFVTKNEDGVIQYYVPPQSHRLVSDNWLDIATAGSVTEFPHEKSCELLERVISWSHTPGSYVLDYFGGSGTTAHAAINLARKQNTRLPFITVEMGLYFSTILVPRLKRAIYSAIWKDGKPQKRDTGISHAFKILRLESYEDTLNNLVLRRTPEQEAALKAQPIREQGEYMLGYFLDVESAGSASVLDVAQFRDPFAYKLKIATSSAGETKDTPVDLVETFNWLLGLKVRHIDAPQGFVTVTGERRDGKKLLVVWRKLGADAVADNASLQRLFDKLQVNPAETSDTDYAAIYVNGAHTLADPHGKIHLTEEEFHRRMFATEQFSGLES